MEQGILLLEPCKLHPELKLHVDQVDGEMRFTYAIFQGRTAKGFLQITHSGWEEDVSYFQLGIAVGKEFRNQGVGSELSRKGIEAFLARFPIPPGRKLDIEAIISESNIASQKTASRSFSNSPTKVTDKFSGEPCLLYEFIVVGK